MAFEFDAGKYSQASGHQKEWGKKIICELNLKGTEHILDLGCGDGALTNLLAEQARDGLAIGIDSSKNMIELARETYKAENIKFIKMDINDIDFENEFDVTFSNAALHWIKDHRRLLTNVSKAIRLGGIIRFNFAGEGNCSNFIEVIRAAMSEEAFARYFEGFEWPWYMPGVDEYEKILKQFGFKETKVWGENADRFFQNAEELAGWIDQPNLVPFLRYIEGPKKRRFRDTVVERMIKKTMQDDGSCFETFRRINVYAVK
jgi:trans-aconitate methyltransferase